MEATPLLLVLVLLLKMSSATDTNCPAGSFLRNKQCTACPAGSYTENPNRRPTCKRCNPCQGGKFLILAVCTGTSDTKCECVEGFRFSTKECRSCEKHTMCGKGQEVQEKGDSFKDTICSDCVHGTYSDTEGGACKPWTNCLAERRQVTRNGSRMGDQICGAPLPLTTVRSSSDRPTSRTPKQTDKPLIEGTAKNEGIAGIVAIIVLPCVFVPFTVYVAVQNRKKQKQLPLDVLNNEDLPVALVTAADDRCSYHCPEEEVGDWQLRQETNPKPPE